VDLNKLSTSEKIVSASAIVLLIASFLAWFEVDTAIGTISGNGWDVGFIFGPLPVLLGLVMLAHVAISNFAPDLALPDLPWPRVHLAAGVAAAALVILKLAMGEDVAGFDLDRGIGLFLAALAAIGLAVGGFLYNKEHDDTATAR